MLDTFSGNIKPHSIEEEIKDSFLSYAMSVIVSRALPDVRDGLKPVHRRVLYAMHDVGLQPTRPYRKSATVVGEVIGKYHPHGDSAVYDTLTRLAQDFSMRYPLVDGQGNFGSVDGDPPAAMRYTEARLTRMATEMLRDISSDTVNFVPNFDESQRQPEVLPARYPNLLVNASDGIAVGMATKIPPHNPGGVNDPYLRREPAPARGAAGAVPKPARQRLRRHRGGYGYQDPAAQPRRGNRRYRRAHRRPRARRRGRRQAHQGAGLPDGRRDRWAARHQGRGDDRARVREGAGEGPHRADQGQPHPDRGNRDPLPSQQELPLAENRRARQGAQAHGHLGPSRRVRPERDAGRHRAQARGGAEGSPEQPL